MTDRWLSSRLVRAAATLLAAAGAMIITHEASAQRDAATALRADQGDLRLDELRQRVRALDGRPGAGEAALELAERLLDRVASDGSDLAVLYGEPTRAQSDRVRTLSAEAHASARRSLAWIEAEIHAIESHADFASDRDLQERRSRLAVEMLEFRRPLAEARAALLLAATDGDEASRRRLAIAAGAAVEGLDLRDPAWDARRLLLLGGAALLADPGSADAAGVALDAFSSCFELIGPEDEARLYVEASLGRGVAAVRTQGAGAARASVRASMARPPFTPRNLRSAPWRLAAADTLFRIGAHEAARAATTLERRDAMARACEGYVELLTRSEEGVESVRPAVYEKLAGLRWPQAAAELPTIAALALADRAMNSGDTGRAVELLDELAGRSDAALGALAGDALWEHARTLLDMAMSDDEKADGLRLRAMGSLLRIGRDHTGWRAAPDAVETACRLGQWLHRRDDDRARADIEALYIDALLLATRDYEQSPSINEWRLELGLVAGAEVGEAALTAITADAPVYYARARHLLIGSMRERMERAADAARADTARAILAQVDETREALGDLPAPPREADAWIVALDLHVAAALIELDELDRAASLATSSPAEGVSRSVFIRLARLMAEAELRDDLDEARRLAAHAARVGAEAMERAQDDEAESSRRWISLHQARALMLIGRAREAVGLLEAIERRGGADRAVRFWKAAAMYDAGDEAGAFAIWRELAGGLEAAGEHDEVFWRCWTRMLGALADRNEDGARSATIRREVVRLRALDGSLGGRPHRGRIEGVIRRLDDRSN